MQRVGLGGWIAAFQKNLPTHCSSIARLRKTSTQDLHKLGFKLSPAHVRQVLGALRKEPLATELAASNGLAVLQAGGPGQAQRKSPENTGGREQELTDREHDHDNEGRASTAVGTNAASEQLDMSVDINGDEAGGGSDNGDAGDDVLAYMEHIGLAEWWYDL
jgi:hypothetical protein